MFESMRINQNTAIRLVLMSTLRRMLYASRKCSSMEISLCICKELKDQNRGSARNLPTEWLELPTGRLKWIKMQFLYIILPIFLRQKPKISSDRGLGASDRGLYVAPSSPPLASPLDQNIPSSNQNLRTQR